MPTSTALASISRCCWHHSGLSVRVIAGYHYRVQANQPFLFFVKEERMKLGNGSLLSLDPAAYVLQRPLL